MLDAPRTRAFIAALLVGGGGACALGGAFALPQTSDTLILAGFALVGAGTVYLSLAKCPRCGAPLVEGLLTFSSGAWFALSFPRRCRKCTAPLDCSRS